MSHTVPSQLRKGIASRDGMSETLFGLWLQWTVLASSALFAVVFTLLADHVLPPLDGVHPRVLLVDTAIFVPAVIAGLLLAMWPLRTVLLRLGAGAFAIAMIAPLVATAVLCAAGSAFMMLWTGSMLDELLASPGLTLFAMALAGLPAMLLAQEMIWPWADRHELALAAMTPEPARIRP